MSRITGKTIIQKVIAILIIMAMTLTDFAIIGVDVVSYAVDMVATNNNNVEFSAYFKKDNETFTNIDSKIDSDNLKLFVEISIKNEGYFNGQIELENSSFNFVGNYSSEYVKAVEGNTVTLNQINAGTTAVIELGIKYINSDNIELTSLNRENTVKLIGTYTDSKKDRKIEGKTNVTINWKSEDEVKALISSKVLTNSTYQINDVNKNIVQVLINSKLENNAYPVKDTKIELSVPVGAEEVKVHKRTTAATNGDMEFSESNYVYDSEKGILTIDIQNNEIDGKIKWNKNVQDTIVATYIYPEDLEIKDTTIDVNSVITTYDNKELQAQSSCNVDNIVDGIITSDIVENEREIYKGKLYTGEERRYNTTVKLNIDYTDIANQVKLQEDTPMFVEGNRKVNIQYIESKISKAKFDEIFGEEGSITIQDQEKNIIANINKDTQADENGYIVVKYNEGVKAITIITSSPIKIGVVDIEHTKSILNNKLSR